ncbi:ankyrin repeat domain-containing protein [Burkholderia sp. PAMC 28687]|uniref:ankyrin repeat domain-containing protein n=1 Tax=Burkholderia sp. PAMC 28687 TaxID=1795874 RepID=UPI0009E9240E
MLRLALVAECGTTLCQWSGLIVAIMRQALAVRQMEASSAKRTAAQAGREECCRLLLSARSTARVDEWGYSPVMRAASGGHAECARLLLRSATWRGASRGAHTD